MRAFVARREGRRTSRGTETAARRFVGRALVTVSLVVAAPPIEAATTVYYLPAGYPAVCGQDLTAGRQVCDEGATRTATPFCEADLTGLALAREALGAGACGPGGSERVSLAGVNYVFLVDDRPLSAELRRLLGDSVRSLGEQTVVVPSRTGEGSRTSAVAVGERYFLEGASGAAFSEDDWRSRIASLASPQSAGGGARGPIEVVLVDPRLPTPSGAAEGVWGSIGLAGSAARLRELCAQDCPTLIRTYEEITAGRVGTEVARLMQTIGGLPRLRFYLVNDFTQDLTQATGNHYRLCRSELRGTGRLGVWPCAWREGRGSSALGKVVLGELHAEDLSGGGRTVPDWHATLIHETVHTLDRTGWDTAHYGPAYGPDGTHYFREILPDSHAVFKEGVANFVGFHFAPSVGRRRIDDLSGNGWLYMAEAGTQARDAAGEGVTRRQFSYLDSSGNRQTTTYDYYRWRDLDAESLLRNELVAAVALFYISQNVENGYQQLLSSFRSTNWRSRTLLTLIGDFVAETDWTWRLGTRDDAASQFALALVDILTHFDFSDADLRSAFIREASLEASILDDYLEHLRPILRAEVASAPIATAVERAKRGILGSH